MKKLDTEPAKSEIDCDKCKENIYISENKVAACWEQEK
jgi:hypothetical protein